MAKILQVERNQAKWYTNASRGNKEIRGIVIHYTAAADGTAKAIANGFATSSREASAHYTVDSTKRVIQSVLDEDVAWHCGADKYSRNCTLRNSDTIGIEMCCRKLSKKTLNASDNDWYVDDETLANTVLLVAHLMKRYDIPIENVVRHYDVTGKECPAMMVGPELQKHYKRSGNDVWKSFKHKCNEMYKAQTVVLRLYKTGTSTAIKNIYPTDSGKSKTTITATVTKKDDEKGVKYKCIASALNVRKTPSGDVITRIKKDDVVLVFDTKKLGDETWGKIVKNSLTGWICLTNYTKKV